ncbi:hypothetical protein IJG21_02920, partial [Candidatus Saccharibacteria bacterium]|nr:hypothetical protein [Candidatus Saccharibacteria bacterium]
MVKKKQTSIDGLKTRKAKTAGSSVVKKTTKKKKPAVSSFDVKVTKRRTAPEELVVADEIKIEEEEIEKKSA